MYQCERLARQLEGIQTIESVMTKLKIKRATAIKYIHLLRKKGLVETKVGSNKIHLYEVSRTPIIKIGNPGYYEILNENSPIQVQEPYEHRVVDREISIEEAIAWAASTSSIRVHIAVLALFNKVTNWSRLYKWAKLHNTRRKVGALYDVARRILRVRKMDLRIKKRLLRANKENKYMVPLMRSKDFYDIEKEWRVYIPFNKKDLMRYKE